MGFRSTIICPAASFPACPTLMTGCGSIVLCHWLEAGHALSYWQTTQLRRQTGLYVVSLNSAVHPETKQILRSVACLLCSSLLIVLWCFVICWKTCILWSLHSFSVLGYGAGSRVLCTMFYWENDPTWPPQSDRHVSLRGFFPPCWANVRKSNPHGAWRCPEEFSCSQTNVLGTFSATTV